MFMDVSMAFHFRMFLAFRVLRGEDRYHVEELELFVLHRSIFSGAQLSLPSPTRCVLFLSYWSFRISVLFFAVMSRVCRCVMGVRRVVHWFMLAVGGPSSVHYVHRGKVCLWTTAPGRPPVLVGSFVCSGKALFGRKVSLFPAVGDV